MEKKEGSLFVCISLFYILSKSKKFLWDQTPILYMYILIIFVVMFMNGWEYYKDFNL